MKNLTQMLMQQWGRTAVRQATNRDTLLLTTSAMMAMLLVGCSSDDGDEPEVSNVELSAAAVELDSGVSADINSEGEVSFIQGNQNTSASDVGYLADTGDAFQLDSDNTATLTSIFESSASETDPAVAYFIAIADNDGSVYIVGSAPAPAPDSNELTVFTIFETNDDGSVEEYTVDLENPTEPDEWIADWVEVATEEVASVSLGEGDSALDVTLVKVTDDTGDVSYETALSGDGYDIESFSGDIPADEDIPEGFTAAQLEVVSDWAVSVSGVEDPTDLELTFNFITATDSADTNLYLAVSATDDDNYMIVTAMIEGSDFTLNYMDSEEYTYSEVLSGYGDSVDILVPFSDSAFDVDAGSGSAVYVDPMTASASNIIQAAFGAAGLSMDQEAINAILGADPSENSIAIEFSDTARDNYVYVSIRHDYDYDAQNYTDDMVYSVSSVFDDKSVSMNGNVSLDTGQIQAASSVYLGFPYDLSSIEVASPDMEIFAEVLAAAGLFLDGSEIHAFFLAVVDPSSENSFTIGLTDADASDDEIGYLSIRIDFSYDDETEEYTSDLAYTIYASTADEDYFDGYGSVSFEGGLTVISDGGDDVETIELLCSEGTTDGPTLTFTVDYTVNSPDGDVNWFEYYELSGITADEVTIDEVTMSYSIPDSINSSNSLDLDLYLYQEGDDSAMVNAINGLESDTSYQGAGEAENIRPSIAIADGDILGVETFNDGNYPGQNVTLTFEFTVGDDFTCGV
jgi:hypothetical protein